MNQFEHIAARLYDTPLAVTLERAEAWEHVVSTRIQDGGERDELHARTVATERLEALAQANQARSTREGYALTESGIAIIPIHGGLVQRGGWMEAESGLVGYNRIARTLRAAELNPDVRGIVFDVDSPGGEVAGMFELADMIAGAEKPTRAVANDTAASAAYLLASAAGKIYATKTATLGSIGILAMHVDRSRAHQKQGLRFTPIVAGARKVEGSSLAPLSDGARSAMQARVDATYSMFVDMVAGYRGIDADEVRATEGAVMQASAAQNAGLIDGVATLGQVIHDFAMELEGSSRTEQRPRALTSAELSLGDIAMDPNATNAKAIGLAMQNRIAGILAHAEARGREQLAQHLAFKTQLTAEEAVAVMLASPKASTSNQFADAMAKMGNPDIGADAPGADPDSPEAAANAIIAYLPRKRAK